MEKLFETYKLNDNMEVEIRNSREFKLIFVREYGGTKPDYNVIAEGEFKDLKKLLEDLVKISDLINTKGKENLKGMLSKLS